jgi:hypothetical protein
MVKISKCAEESQSSSRLDLVLRGVIEDARIRGKWFDFGASTEHDGTYLDSGLAQYKESFGGRTIVQDSYRLNLT